MKTESRSRVRPFRFSVCNSARAGAVLPRSRLVAAKRQEWKRKGLRLLFLPPYCPHLNSIETLWRQIKYRWLGPEAYADFETLCRSVTDVLDQVGTKYRLSFA